MVANLACGQLNRHIEISLSKFTPDNLVSRDRFGCPVPRKPPQSLFPPAFGDVFIYYIYIYDIYMTSTSTIYITASIRTANRQLPSSIGSVPSLSDHAIAYRWRLPPRVRRHRVITISPQGRSRNLCSLFR